MRPPRLRLREVHVSTNGTSQDVPACEDVRLSAVLEAEDGSTIKREEPLLVYQAIMADPEQLPFMIAEAIRTMMIPANPSPKRSL